MTRATRRPVKVKRCINELNRGFTLIELLVVISIMTLLLAILLPALGKARGAAQSLVCKSNLRQVGMLFEIFAQDNKGLVPAQAAWSKLGKPSNVQWWDLLATLDVRTRSDRENFLICPANQKVPVVDGVDGTRITNYAQTGAVMSAWRFRKVFGDLGGPSEWGVPFRLEEYKTPSEKIHVNDGNDWRTDPVAAIFNWVPLTFFRTMTAAPHNGRTNAVYADSHVAEQDLESFTGIRGTPPVRDDAEFKKFFPDW